MEAGRELDRAELAVAAQIMARLSTRPITRLSREELEQVEQSAVDIFLTVLAERERRDAQPRGRPKLRLAAKDGELTKAGERLLSGRGTPKPRRTKTAPQAEVAQPSRTRDRAEITG